MSQLTADFLLLLVTLIWGTSFVIVKKAISTMGPLTFIAVRFLIAGLVLLVWHVARAGRPPKAGKKAGKKAAPRGDSGAGEPDGAQGKSRREPAGARWFDASRQFYMGGALTGAALFFSYATQTLGLVTVGAGKAAFITGLYVVIVPVASRALLKVVPDRASIFGVILATAGLGLLSLNLPIRIAPGDFLVFLCALGFAAHILLVGHYSSRGDTVLFAAIQLLVVSAGSFICALIAERPITVAASAWGAILFTAIAATSFAFLAQSAVQRYTSPTHTALIFSAEPVFGALFAWLLAGEVLLAREIVGAVGILAGIILSEVGSMRGSSGAKERAKE